MDYEVANLSYWMKAKPNYCAYTDEDWGYGEGNAPHQKRVKKVIEDILKQLGSEQKIEDVFSANLFFFRSPDAVKLRSYVKANHDCWEYHEKFLQIVAPKIIVCNGNDESFSAFSLLRNHFKIEKSEKKAINRRCLLKYFILENAPWSNNQALVLGLPHLSYPRPLPEITRITSELIAESGFQNS